MRKNTTLISLVTLFIAFPLLLLGMFCLESVSTTIGRACIFISIAAYVVGLITGIMALVTRNQ